MLKEKYYHLMLFTKQKVCGNLGHKMGSKIVTIILVFQAGLMQIYSKIGLKNTVTSFKKKQPGKKVVLADNITLYILSCYIIETYKKENIYFVCLPSNSTHLTQPLNVAFLHPMKVAWRKILSDWKSSTKSLKYCLIKTIIPCTIITSYKMFYTLQ